MQMDIASLNKQNFDLSGKLQEEIQSSSRLKTYVMKLQIENESLSNMLESIQA